MSVQGLNEQPVAANGKSSITPTTTTSSEYLGATKTTTPPKTSLDTSGSSLRENSTNGTGDEHVSNALPSRELLKEIEDYQVFDADGRARSFKSVYTGPNVPRRVLVIFIRHFYCGMCQAYLQQLSASITPSDLLALPIPTSIAIIGCGQPTMIPSYLQVTNCPFPLYADPTRSLYNKLGLCTTLAAGERPDYQRQSFVKNALGSMWRMALSIPTGKFLHGGNQTQNGGEFLFEPAGSLLSSPVSSPNEHSEAVVGLGVEESKRVTWCHRMRNTRDHAEIPEIREVLGLDGEGRPGKNMERWERAVRKRKGTGLSAMSDWKKSSENVVLTGAPAVKEEAAEEPGWKPEPATDGRPVALPTVS